MWRDQRITMFLPGYVTAHNDTNYGRWAGADAPYGLGATDDRCSGVWLMIAAFVLGSQFICLACLLHAARD